MRFFFVGYFTVCIEQVSDCRFGVSPVNYPDPEHAASGLPNHTHLEEEVRFVQLKTSRLSHVVRE